MSEPFVFKGLAQPADLACLISRVHTFGERQGWSAHIDTHVHLILEELIVNIISHATQGQSLPALEVVLTQTGAELEITLADTAVAFNPLLALQPDLQAELNERQIGGLGIYLVHQLTDSQSYQRDGAWNRLRLIKTCQTANSSPS
jgi:anti-sigma regulatory factor (Ser/Thr protein kinase)